MVVEETNPAAAAAASHPSGISQDKIDNIMSGISNTGTVKLNNHRKKLRQRFDIIKKLGQGTYGKVQLGINKETGQEVAIKTIKKCKIEAEADLIRIRREVQIMSSVQHPNIIHIYEVFENREKMVLVMEFAAGGELYDYLSDRKVLSEDEARRVFRQVSTAVYYCHKHKICHRDLKLENILLDENGNAKIADFGLSNVFDDRRLLATFCGSPLYASPEIVKGTPYQGPEVDCWSLGVLLYTLVYGSMPFDGSNFSRLVKQISQGDYYEPKKTSRASPLIREMLTANPEKRADIEKICQHWWVNEGYKESCLELAEALANQTPVRLDVLLSLSPMSVTADQLVVPSGDPTKFNDRVSRSHSVGSIRCVANSEAERRILDMVAAGGEEALMPSPTRILTPISPNQIKRKIEVSASTGNSTETVIKKEKAMEDSDVVEMETTQSDLNFEKNKSPSKLMVESTSTNIINDDTNNLNAIPKLESVNESELPLAETSPTKVIKKFVNKHKTADLISAINKISPEKKEENVHQSQIIKPRKNSLSDEANKFNTDRGRLGGLDRKNSIEKGKLNIVSGVNVSNFKKEFERRSSIPSMNLDNKPVEIKAKNVEKSLKNINYAESPQKSLEESTSTESFSLAEARRSMENSIALLNEARNESSKNVDILCAKTENIAVSDNKSARERKLQNARDIIGNAIQPGVRKFSVSKQTYVIPEHSTPLTYIHQPLREQSMSSSFKKTSFDENKDNNIKTSKAEITLKSATLPRRKTSKAEIKLEIQPPISEQPMRFSTEMKHRLPDIKSAPIEDNSKSISSLLHHRATSLGPAIDENREHLITTQKPPMYNKQYFNSRRSGTNYPNTTQSNINNSQLTNLGGTQPIKKSPREFIIPIAVEGGGFITPRSGSIEPSELNQTFGNTNLARKSRLVSPFLSDVDSEENSPFQRTQITSANRDDDLDPRFSLHRLRSSRPMGKKNSQDSQSSGEEEDDDGFEILTAENLFSTLLQRVRALTNRLNVNNDLSTGFPNSSRLLSNMRTTPFWNQGSFERRLNGNIGAPWRHSLSRDIGSDIESMFSRTATLPRGKELPKSIKKKTTRPIDISSDKQVGQPIDLADLDLSRLQLSKKEFETLSSITPSLPTSFQQQLIAKLPPNHSRKLSRTLSMQNNMEEMHPIVSQKNLRKTDDNISETLKMKYNGTKKSSQNKTIKPLTNEFVSEEQQIYPNCFGKCHTENISQLKEPLTFSKTNSIKNIIGDLSYKKEKDSDNFTIPAKLSDNTLKTNNLKSFDKLPSGYLSPPPIAVRSKNSLEKRNLSLKTSSVLKSNSVPKEVFSVNNQKKSLERFNNCTELQETIPQQPLKNILITHEISDIDKQKLTNIILKELENLSGASENEIRNNKESDDIENKLKHDNKSKKNKEVSKSNLNNVQNINLKTKCNLDIEKSSEFQKEEIQKKTSKLKRPKSYPYKEIKTFSNLPTSNNSELVNFNDTNSNCKTSTPPDSKFINVMHQSNDPNDKIDIEKNDFNKLLEMTMKDAINNIIIRQKNDEIKTERTKSLNNININNETINILGTKLKKSEEIVPTDTSSVKTKTKQSEDNNSSGKKSRKGLFLTLGKKIENLRKNSKTDESNNISKLNNTKLKGEEMTKSIPSSAKHNKISSSNKTENENLEDSKIQFESVAQNNKNLINANDSQISESGLLKKAVSAGDINKCSVKKLLGLFKRFEKNSKEQKVVSACSTSNVENSINKIPIKKNSPTDGEKLFTKVKKSTDLMDISNENCKKSEIFSLDTYKNKLSGNVEESNFNINNNNNNKLRKEPIYENTDNIDNGLTNLKDLKKNNSFHISRKFSSDNLNDINDNHIKYHHKNSLRPMSSYHNYNIGDSPVDDIDLRFEDLLSCSEVNRITSNPSSPCNLVSHLEFPSTSTDNNQNDTMMDRIKRRSFYCRFNDNKPKRQSNIVGAAAREYYRETEAKLRSRPQTKFPSFYATTGRRTDSNMSKLISSINNGTSNSLDSADREYTTKINEQIPMSALHYRKSKPNIHNEKSLLPHSSSHNHYNPPEWNYNHYNTTRNRALLLNETGAKCDSKSNIDCVGNITRPRQYETRTLSSSGCTQNNTRLPLNSSSKHHLRSHSRDATRYLLPFSAIPRSPPNV